MEIHLRRSTEAVQNPTEIRIETAENGKPTTSELLFHEDLERVLSEEAGTVSTWVDTTPSKSMIPTGRIELAEIGGVWPE